MKHWVKQQNTDISAISNMADNISIGDVSVGMLIDNSLVALQREVKNILVMSAKGKLDAATARDLRDHLKLLFELEQREADLLKRLTDDQLKAILTAREQAKTEKQEEAK